MEVAAGSASALVEAIKLIGIATRTAAPGDPYTLVARIAAALAAAATVVGAVTAGIAKVKGNSDTSILLGRRRGTRRSID